MTRALRCERPTSEAKPASATRSGACRVVPVESARWEIGPFRRREPRSDGSDVEWALEQVLRVGAELVARAMRVRADHDLLPPDPAGVVRVAVGDRGRAVEQRPLQHDLQPCRVQAAGAEWVRERGAARDEARRATVDGQVRAGCDPACVRASVDLPGLEGRDLGHVQHVEDVEPVARDLDPAEAVDGEVAERVRERCRRCGERGPTATKTTRRLTPAPSGRPATRGARSGG